MKRNTPPHVCEKRKAHLAGGRKGNHPGRVRGPGWIEELTDMVTLKPRLERGWGVSLIKETRFLEETSSKQNMGIFHMHHRAQGG